MDVDEKAKFLLKYMNDKTEYNVICEIFPTNITTTFERNISLNPMSPVSPIVSMEMRVDNPSNLLHIMEKTNNKRYIIVEVKDE